jgi:hypothetical protein
MIMLTSTSTNYAAAAGSQCRSPWMDTANRSAPGSASSAGPLIGLAVVRLVAWAATSASMSDSA